MTARKMKQSAPPPQDLHPGHRSWWTRKLEIHSGYPPEFIGVESLSNGGYRVSIRHPDGYAIASAIGTTEDAALASLWSEAVPARLAQIRNWLDLFGEYRPGDDGHEASILRLTEARRAEAARAEAEAARLAVVWSSLTLYGQARPADRITELRVQPCGKFGQVQQAGGLLRLATGGPCQAVVIAHGSLTGASKQESTRNDDELKFCVFSLDEPREL